MNFADFYKNTTVTKDGTVVQLYEGIDHIEALPIDAFLHAVENLSKFIASEKLDGANMIFGFDEDGKFYTSREAKRGGRFYSADDWENKAAWNGFKSAHAALQKVSPLLRTELRPGEAVECEVLFGRQPNAITYGSSYIAFLRMIIGDNKQQPDQGKIKRLAKIMEGEVVSVVTNHITTDDGIKIKSMKVEHTWKFTSTSFIDTQQFKDINLDSELADLRKFLGTLNKAGNMGLTNGEIMLVKLNSVPKHIREDLKTARETVLSYVEHHYKLPIKEKLLNSIIRKLSPSLRDVEIHSHEDTGVEGAVFLNPDTLQQFKIVDKDVFTIINQFNYAVRMEIKNTGPTRSPKGNATIGVNGDIFGNMLKKIADVLGSPELGRYSRISTIIGKVAGSTPSETVRNFAESLPVRNPNTVKTGVIRAIKSGISELDKGLQQYNNNWKDYRLQLKSGKEISYTDEIHKRTLMVFAEVRDEMHNLLLGIQNAKDIDSILTVLYGVALKKIHR
jgi:hypothetical protein